MTDLIRRARGIPSHHALCPECSGSGYKTYGSTATWHGGIGGAAMTEDVCDKCWGSGTTQPWPSHREFQALRRAETGKVTNNAILLTGYLAACLGNDKRDAMYRAHAYEAEAAQLTVKHTVNGNRYLVTVRQTSGTE